MSIRSAIVNSKSENNLDLQEMCVFTRGVLIVNEHFPVRTVPWYPRRTKLRLEAVCQFVFEGYARRRIVPDHVRDQITYNSG